MRDRSDDEDEENEPKVNIPMTAPFCSVCSTHCTGQCKSTAQGQEVSCFTPEEFYLRVAGEKVRKKKIEGRLLIIVLSAMYAKLMVVMGISFPLTLVISPNVPKNVYTVFYLYLYFVSIGFLVYAFTLHSKLSTDSFRAFFHRVSTAARPNRLSSRSSSTSSNNEDDDVSDKVSTSGLGVAVDPRNCGSFYLRVGAVAFGIGSMIYSGLEFIQFLELDPSCIDVIQALNPSTHMVFTFVQLYFIFINSKMSFHRHETIARFGLMHMVATNLCVWLLAVVEESQHEISHLPAHVRSVYEQNFGIDYNSSQNDLPDDYVVSPNTHPRTRRAAVLQMGDSCRRMDVFSQLVQDISPFLFPCIIEYSLICAAICYIMWKQVGKKRVRHPSDSVLDMPIRRHQYSVDCSHAIKGLFTGILVLVLAIISVILFFVLINREEYRELAVQEAYISEMILSMLTTAAVLVAMLKINGFRYTHTRNVELDNILLIVGQIGIYLFSIFSIISGHLASTGILNNFVVFSSLSRLIQATVQTIFILDASQRAACSADDADKKPGREMVTFLLVCNFAMWIITTLETGRHDSNSIQLRFFGFWGWTIIARISTPLAIFYRFHSTVCLCEIWKKLYKLKGEQI